MLRYLLTQKSVNQQTVTDFRYPRACRFRKYQIENRLWELPRPTFFKTWFLVHKKWLNLAKTEFFRFFWKSLILYCIRSNNVSNVFRDLKNVKIATKSFMNFMNFMNLNHILKKVGRGSSHNLFSIWYFRNLHALGYLKSATVFWFTEFWVNKFLSMMCQAYNYGNRSFQRWLLIFLYTGHTTVTIVQLALIKHCLWMTQMVTHSKIVDPLYILHENM
jgi:hypothetical protein